MGGRSFAASTSYLSATLRSLGDETIGELDTKVLVGEYGSTGTLSPVADNPVAI